MVLVQQWPVFIVFFLSNVGQGNVFYDILGKKSLSRISKTRASKRRKNHIFPKGLTHGFGLTMSSFSIFFLLGNIGQKMSFAIFWNETTLF